MQASKIQVGEQYHIDAKAITEQFGYMRHNITWPENQKFVVTVVEKGVVQPGHERANGIRIRLGNEAYSGVERRVIDDYATERGAQLLDQRWPQTWTIPSRWVIEGVSERITRQAAEQAVRDQRVRAEKERVEAVAEGVTMESIGKLIEHSEQETGKHASTYIRELEALITAAQQEKDRVEAALSIEGESYWSRRVTCEGDKWPSFNTNRIMSEVNDVRDAASKYRQTKHTANHLRAIKPDPEPAPVHTVHIPVNQ